MPNSSHLGEITLRREARGVSVAHVRYEPGVRLAKHAHDRACFAWIQTGGQVETFGTRALQLHARQVLFRPAAEEHHDHFLSRTSCVLVELSEDWLKIAATFGRIPSEPRISASPHASRFAAELYAQSEEKDLAAGLAIEGLSYTLAAEFLRESSRCERNYPPRWLRILHEQLSENPCARSSLTDLATSSGVHPVHLSRQFRRFYGVTLWEFLRRRRIEVAAQKISCEETSLCQIAYGVGFVDQAQFTRTFKRFMGVTPSEFRHSVARRPATSASKRANHSQKR